jgi:AcrR family transcriptional regulator
MAGTVSKGLERKQGSEEGRILKSKRRMEEVYTKAAGLFREKGYMNTSVNGIARELNIQKGSLYYYIEDKETLLFEILNRTMDAMLVQVGDLPKRVLSPDEKLALAIRTHIVSAVRYLNEFSVLLHDTKYLRPALRDIILSKRRHYEEVFLEILRDGISEGTFTKKDEKMLVFLILGSCNWLYQWFSPKGPKSPEQIAGIFSEVLLNGLVTK